MPKFANKAVQTEAEKPKSLTLFGDVHNPLSLPPIPTFSGEGSTIDVIAKEYCAWKVLLDDWIALSKALGVVINKASEFYMMKYSLRGEAALLANDVVKGIEDMEGEVKWKDIIEHLDRVYLIGDNVQMIIAQVKNVKQTDEESVIQYAARFNQVHRRLIGLGASNRDAAVTWFIDGLIPPLRDRVNEKLLEDHVVMKYDKDDVSGAISCVMNIAIAKEMAAYWNDDVWEDGFDSDVDSVNSENDEPNRSETEEQSNDEH